MEKVYAFLLVAGLTCVLLLIFLRPILFERRNLIAYKRELNERIPLSDEHFCQKASLPQTDMDLVKRTRECFGKFRKVNPLLIYPEDDIFTSIGISYDDDLAGILYDAGILEECEHWFPAEEMNQLSDIFPLIHQMNQKSEPADSGNG